MTPLVLAEMVVEPVLSAVAMPLDTAELLIVAAVVLEDAQATCAVTSLWVLSLKTAVAVSCAFVPAARCALAGVIWIDVMVGAPFVVKAAAPLLTPAPEQHATRAKNPHRRPHASSRAVGVRGRTRRISWHPELL
jgi:hypothetical protein